MGRNKSLFLLVLAALFLAIGQVLPFITAQIPQIGAMLSPMHIPVLLCGYVCGPLYGALVGVICPLLRSVLFGFPKMVPTALAMAFELCAYGFFAGFLFSRMKKKTLPNIYLSLIITMVLGRLVWGLAQTVILGLTGSAFTLKMFLAGALINAVPAIILQLVLIPYLVLTLDKLVHKRG